MASMQSNNMQWKGCVYRIRECVFELLCMEDEDLNDYDEESWELMASELRLKSTFLYLDLTQIISFEKEEHKKLLTDLGNNLFYHMEELDNAVKKRSISLTQEHYNDTAHALHQLMPAILLPC